MARPVLVRIPFSHYCRKVEWAFTQLSIDYDTWDMGLGGGGRMTRVWSGGTVPVVLADGRFLGGSDVILDWAHQQRPTAERPLYPTGEEKAIRAWEADVDDDLGVVARREAYRVAYNEPGKMAVPWYGRLAARLGHGAILGVLKHYKVRRFDDTDPELLQHLVAKTAAQLDKNGTGHLFGPDPTAADITTAALAQPLLYAARARDYAATVKGWPAFESFVRDHVPKKLSSKRRRFMGPSRWRRLEAAAADAADAGA